MKKIILLLSIYVIIHPVISQNQIVEPWKRWANLHEFCHPQGTEYSTDYIRFEGDTVVEGITYKKVWRSEDENHENWMFYGYFIREENGKVYLRRPFEEEGLCYDFTLQQPGDTVTIHNPLTASPLLLTLTETDSVETTDGWRERWKLTAEGHQTPEYWIKGIGSMSGVLNSGTAVFGGVCGSATLLCEHEHDTLIYQNPEFGSCYIVTTGMEENEMPDFKVFSTQHNPAVRILFSKTGHYNIKITTLQGKILTETTVNGNSWSSSPVRLPHGILFVTVSHNSQKQTRKIIFP